MFRKALVPVDGSDLALAALPHASAIVGGDGELVLLTVIETHEQLRRRMSSASAALGGADFNEQTLAEAATEAHHAGEQTLQEALARLDTAAQSRSTTVVVHGDDHGASIVEVAAEHGCDVIVMATHGRSGLKRAILGSVADYVVRHSDRVPVLLVRPEEQAG